MRSPERGGGAACGVHHPLSMRSFAALLALGLASACIYAPGDPRPACAIDVGSTYLFPETLPLRYQGAVDRASKCGVSVQPGVKAGRNAEIDVVCEGIHGMLGLEFPVADFRGEARGASIAARAAATITYGGVIGTVANESSVTVEGRSGRVVADRSSTDYQLRGTVHVRIPPTSVAASTSAGVTVVELEAIAVDVSFAWDESAFDPDTSRCPGHA